MNSLCLSLSVGSLVVPLNPALPAELQAMLWYAGLVSAGVCLVASAVYLAVTRRARRPKPVETPPETPPEEEVVPGILMHMHRTVVIPPRVEDTPAPAGHTPREAAPAVSVSDTLERVQEAQAMPAADDPATLVPRAAVFRDPASISHLARIGWTEEQIARRLGWGRGEVRLALHLAHLGS
jgi:hypothetical protein